MPFVYLYRGERADSGGAGKWRGGNGLEAAVVAHRTDDFASRSSPRPGRQRLQGPGRRAARASRQRFAGFGTRSASSSPTAACRATSPSSPRCSASSTAEFAEGPSFRHARDDVLVYQYVAGGGFGDPLTRDPAHVAADVHDGTVHAQVRRDVHAVVIAPAAGEADEPATASRRQTLPQRSARRGRPGAAPSPAPPVGRSMDRGRVPGRRGRGRPMGWRGGRAAAAPVRWRR